MITIILILLFLLLIVEISLFIDYNNSRVQLIKAITLITNLNDRVENKINHLYLLSKILHEGLCSPLHKQLFISFYNNGPNKMPKTPYGHFLLFKKVIDKIIIDLIEPLTTQENKIIKIIEKNKCIEQKTELNNVYNLIETVDQKSTKEHIQRVMAEITLSVSKLQKVNSDL